MTALILAGYDDAVHDLLDDEAEAVYSGDQVTAAVRWALDQANIYLAPVTPYTIKDLDGAGSSTVPVQYEGPITIGAAGFCAFSRSMGVIETNNINDNAARDLRSAGEYFIDDFYRTVNPNYVSGDETGALALQAAKAADDLALQAARAADDLALQDAKDQAALARLGIQVDHEIELQSNVADDALGLQQEKGTEALAQIGAKAEAAGVLQNDKQTHDFLVRAGMVDLAKAKAMLAEFKADNKSDASSGFAVMDAQPTDTF